MSHIGEIVAFVPRYHIRGYGRRGLRTRYRLGYGLGSVILSFFKPLLRKGLHSAIDVAQKVATDVVKGHNLKETIQKHATQKVQELLSSTQQKTQEEQPTPAPISSTPREVPLIVKARKRPAPKKRFKVSKLKKRGQGQYKALKYM